MPVTHLLDDSGTPHALQDVKERGLPGYPPPFARIVAEKLERDRRHAALRVTTTALFSCPLRTLIPRVLDVEVPFRDRLALTIGTLLHEAMAAYPPLKRAWVSEACTCPDPLPLPDDEELPDDVRERLNLVRVGGYWHLESCGEAQCTFEGTIDGVPVTGLVDALEWVDDGEVVLWDWKFRNANVLRYRDSASPEDQMQLSVNAELARQQGYGVAECVSATVTMRGVIVTRFAPWDIEDVLRARPNGGKEGEPPTVREILHVLDDALKKLREGADPREVLRTLPRVGQEMWKGYGRNACTSYCDVSEACVRVTEGW